MIKYNVRSRQLIDIVGDIRREKIIISPYFQRNLVWRQIHKQDFIKTILLGYPFPQIFLAKGGLNVEELTSISLIVDGQQRMNSIIEFISDKFAVDGIAIIELQLEGDNPEIKEVFQRLNRTFYSLTNIEKLATEYAPSELMLLAKLLAKEIDIKTTKDDIKIDPNIPESFMVWAAKKKVDSFHSLILEREVFTPYEISRKVHLMMMLNVLGTIDQGFFNRNIPTALLEEYSENYPEKDDVIVKMNGVAKIYLDLKLPTGSYWYNKANFFSLLIVLFENHDDVANKSPRTMSKGLIKFEKNLPEDYALAAKEAVNNKRERLLRHTYIENILLESR
jgi:hypothetical protein